MRNYDHLIHKLQTQLLFEQAEIRSLIEGLLSEPIHKQFQSEHDYVGHRIHWNHYHMARKRIEEGLDCPGIYFFGNGNKLAYIGLSGEKKPRPLKKRLESRYLRASPIRSYVEVEEKKTLPPQFEIASAYEGLLKEKGYKHLPEWLIKEYKENHKGRGMVRLAHAEQLARRGLENAWVAIFPVSSELWPSISILEKQLISLAKLDNHELLND